MSFFSELKRRKVFRVAIAYAAVGWLLVEVSSVVLPTFDAPEWVLKVITFLVVLGFPLTVALAWAFELTPTGLRRETGTDAKPETPARQAQETPRSESVAVLPFVDVSQDRDNEHFTDGLTEELLNVLTGIPDLRVASRTSCFAFKDRNVALSEVAEKLHVDHVIEGSVRKAGNRLRITAQLIETQTDSHLWSENYDRELEDIFAIQDDIAQKIGKALRLTLRPQDFPHPTTENARAYDYYLRGRGAYDDGSHRNLEYAIRMFRRATDVDPGFVKAWNSLTESCAINAIYYGIEAARAESDRASLRALELAPDDAEALAARGFALIAAERYADATKEFEKAIKLDPTTSRAYHNYARAAFHQGHLPQSLELFEKAAQANPEDWESMLMCLQLYRKFDDHEGLATASREGLQRAQRFLETYPNNQRAYYLGATAWYYLGEMEKAQAWADLAFELAPDDAATRYNLACFYAELGNKDKAFACLQNAIASRSWIENDPNMDPLRDDPRFAAYLETLK